LEEPVPDFRRDTRTMVSHHDPCAARVEWSDLELDRAAAPTCLGRIAKQIAEGSPEWFVVPHDPGGGELYAQLRFHPRREAGLSQLGGQFTGINLRGGPFGQ